MWDTQLAVPRGSGGPNALPMAVKGFAVLIVVYGTESVLAKNLIHLNQTVDRRAGECECENIKNFEFNEECKWQQWYKLSHKNLM